MMPHFLAQDDTVRSDRILNGAMKNTVHCNEECDDKIR